VDFSFDDTMGRDPRIIVDIAQKEQGGALSEKQMAWISSELKEKLDATETGIHRVPIRNRYEFVGESRLAPAPKEAADEEKKPFLREIPMVSAASQQSDRVVSEAATSNSMKKTALISADPLRERYYEIATPFGLHSTPSALASSAIKLNDAIRGAKMTHTRTGASADISSVLQMCGLEAYKSDTLKIELDLVPDASPEQVEAFWTYLETEIKDPESLENSPSVPKVPVFRRIDNRAEMRATPVSGGNLSQNRPFQITNGTVVSNPAYDQDRYPVLKVMGFQDVANGVRQTVYERILWVFNHVLAEWKDSDPEEAAELLEILGGPEFNWALSEDILVDLLSEFVYKTHGEGLRVFVRKYFEFILDYKNAVRDEDREFLATHLGTRKYSFFAKAGLAKERRESKTFLLGQLLPGQITREGSTTAAQSDDMVLEKKVYHFTQESKAYTVVFGHWRNRTFLFYRTPGMSAWQHADLVREVGGSRYEFYGDVSRALSLLSPELARRLTDLVPVIPSGDTVDSREDFYKVALAKGFIDFAAGRGIEDIFKAQSFEALQTALGGIAEVDRPFAGIVNVPFVGKKFVVLKNSRNAQVQAALESRLAQLRAEPRSDEKTMRIPETRNLSVAGLSGIQSGNNHPTPKGFSPRSRSEDREAPAASQGFLMREYEVQGRFGLHVRPAGDLAKLAGRLYDGRDSRVAYLTYNYDEFVMDDTMEILKRGIQAGKITVRIKTKIEHPEKDAAILDFWEALERLQVADEEPGKALLARVITEVPEAPSPVDHPAAKEHSPIEQAVEALRHLEFHGASFQKRSPKWGNATPDIVAKAGRLWEIRMHMLGRSASPVITSILKDLDVAAKQVALSAARELLQRDIDDYDVKRLEQGIRDMVPSTVKREGARVTGQTTMEGVVVDLVIDLTAANRKTVGVGTPSSIEIIESVGGVAKLRQSFLGMGYELLNATVKEVFAGSPRPEMRGDENQPESVFKRNGPTDGLRTTVRTSFMRGEMRRIVEDWLPRSPEIVAAAKQLGLYSQQSLTFEMKDPRKVRLWIALKVLEEMEAHEGRIDNEQLQLVLTKVLASLPKEVRAAVGREGDAVELHANLSGLSEQAWSELARNFSVVLGLLVTLNAHLAINVNVPANQLQAIRQKFDALEGISMDPKQLQFVSSFQKPPFESSRLSKAKSFALLAREGGLLGAYRKNVRRWFEPSADMKQLAAGFAVALLYEASDKKPESFEPLNPSKFNEVFTALVNAIIGYASIRRSA